VISFVVPAHNEEQLLDRTLTAIEIAAKELAQPHEVIVVDDSSTDRTAAIASARGATVVSVQFRHIARTRNAGAGAARGDLFVFVDADTVVPAATLRASWDACRTGAVGGGARLRFDGYLAPWTAVGQRMVDLFMRTWRVAAGCYIYCTRAAFEAVGGFDEQLFALEEIVFSRALQRQGRVVILRESVVSSGRKLRAGSGWRVFRLALRLMRHGPAMLRGRERLSLWYGTRRPDL
jgi:glycosyltransferase involved in cell wall biosynthesis